MAAIDTPTAPPAPTPNTTNVGRPTGDDLAHCYCQRCLDPQDAIAMCGHRPAHLLVIPPPPETPRCVVCVDLMWTPCPRCGR